MKKTLVLDACQRSALAVTRSLGMRGVPVYTADETPNSLAGASRYAIKHMTYHSARVHPREFIGDIRDFCNENAIEILFPMTELTSNLLLKYQNDIPNLALPFSSPETVAKLADKCELFHLAALLDVPMPRTWFVDAGGAIPDDDSIPAADIVLKPGKSWVEHEGEWLHTSVRFADNPQQANIILADDKAFSAHPFLLQEKVPGAGQGIFAIYDRGRPLAFFAHHRIREKPPGGGVSVLSESVSVDPVLEQHARKLLDSVQWHGVAMVEFKCDTHGICHLMEINTRFWGSLQLAIDAGVDFPWILYQLTCGDQPEAISEYNQGKRLRWLLGDLDRLYIILKNNSFPIKEKLQAIASFLKPSPFSTRHETNRWDDMSPFWWELKEYLKNLLS